MKCNASIRWIACLLFLGIMVQTQAAPIPITIIEGNFNDVPVFGPDRPPSNSPWTFAIGPNWLEDEADTEWGTVEDAGYFYATGGVHQAKLLNIGKTDYHVFQNLGVSLQPFTEYVMTVAVGRRDRWSDLDHTNNLASFSLYVGNNPISGGTLLEEITVNFLDLVPRSIRLVDVSLSYTTGASTPSGDLYVVLSNPSVAGTLGLGEANPFPGTPRAHFDNVRLTREPVENPDIRLLITHLPNNQTRLSWPLTAGGFLLQHRESFDDPYAFSSANVVNEGLENVVYDTPPVFRTYRLVRP